MLSHSERFGRVLTSSVQKLADRVDVLFNGQVVVGGEGQVGIAAESFDVSYDRTAAILARGNLTAIEPTRVPTVADPGVLSPYGYELQLWRGLEFADGTRELMSLGIFPIQKSAWDGVTLKGSIEFFDRSKLVSDALFEEDYPVAAGTNIGVALQAMISAGVPGLTFAFATVPFTTPAVVFSANTNRWDAARALAKSCGCEIFFDRAGRCVLRPEPGQDPTPVWLVAAGANLTGSTLVLDREPARNRVIVTGENTANSEVYRGVATDDDPASPTFYDGPFGRKPMFWSSEFISSNDQAAAVAKALLTARSGVARVLALACLPNPAAEAGDIVQVTHGGLGVDELYILDKFTIAGGADALMGMPDIDITVETGAAPSMVVGGRYILAVTADAAPTPEETALTSEDFDNGGLDGQALSTLNSAAVALTGAGTSTLLLAGARSRTGGLSCLIDGVTQRYGTWAIDASTDYAAHDFHMREDYWFPERAGSDDGWLGGVRDGTDTAFAFQFGLDSTSHLIGRDGSAGAPDATSAGTVPANVWSRIITIAGGGVVSHHAFTGSTEDSTDLSDAVATVTYTTSATQFTNDNGGLLATISGTGTATGNLTNVEFESGTNNTAVPSSYLGGSWFGTSGNCKISTSHPQNGTRGLRIGCGLTDPAYNSGRWTHASHTNHFVSFFLYIGAAGSANTIIYQLRDGTGSVTAAEVAVSSSRQIVLRDGTTGVATSAALTANTMYKVVVSYSGTGDQVMRYYTGANLLSTNTADAVVPAGLTGALTATNFTDDLIGLIATASGTPDIFIDDFRSDSTALPVGTTAVGVRCYWEHSFSDSAVQPAPLDTGQDPPPPSTDGFFPWTGIWLGATTGTVGTQGGSTASGMTTYTTATGGIRPHLVHFYKPSSSWNGIWTTEERLLCRPTSGTAAMPFWTWKPNQALSWAQIAAGAHDTQIRAVARGIAQNGVVQFFGIQHEPENDSVLGDPGYTRADYAAMFRHVVEVMRNERPILTTLVCFVWNMMGYSSHAGTNGVNYDTFFPGEDVVGAIGYDPYFETGRTGLGLSTGLFNENVDGTSQWEGFYAWAQEKHPTIKIVLCEWGTDFNDFTDSQAATRIGQVTDGVEDYPGIGALVYWNSTVASGIDAQLNGHTNAIAAYRTLAELDYCTQLVAA